MDELKIIISAVTTDAKKKLSEVKKELGNIDKESKSAGNSIGKAMASVGKAAAAAVGAVVAVTGAMVALGKSSMEFQKEQGRLISSFQSVGSSAEQATKTYKELYAFLGDTGKATEAASLLAQMTTNEQSLTEWTTILQGAYAKLNESISVEALAESANETANVGKVTGQLADALNWVGVSEDAVNAKLATMNTQQEREAYLRGLLNSLYSDSAALYQRNNQSLIAYNQAQANLHVALAEATRYAMPLMTVLANLATTLLTILKPAFETVAAVIIVFVQWIIAAVKWVGGFFGMFSESANAIQDTSTAIGNMSTGLSSLGSGKNNLSDYFDDATASAKELKRQTMGFDELNVVSKPVSASGAGGGAGIGGTGVGAGVNVPAISMGKIDLPSMDGFEDKIEDVKEKMKGVGALLLSFLAPLALFELYEWFPTIVRAIKNFDLMSSKLRFTLGYLLIIAGAFITIKGYSDAWVNGVNWGNLATVLVGLGITITGIGLAFGGMYASIAVVAAGVALLVLGVKDFIKNGPTMQNTILIIGGAIAVAVGLATAGLSVLVSAIIGAVAAIGAFTAAILLEEPAIKSVEDAQLALNEAKEKAAAAEMDYINAIDNAESAMKRLEEAEKAAGVTGEELYKQVQDGTLDYANMTDAQKEVYKAYLDNEQKQKDLKASTEAFNKAKKEETIASYENQLALAKESGNYDEYKKSVIDAFEKGELSADEARDLIEKSMSEMSDASQKTFMEDLPGDITKGLDPHKYESTGTKIKKWFQNLWKDIKNFFSDAGTWFKNVGTKIGDAISGAVKGAVSAILTKIIERINSFFKLINGAVDIINKIPGVNIKKLKMLDIPKLAKGGIVNSATLAEIGERGREAVLPLENNTGWMDILADRIASRNQSPSRIILNVDGKQLGQATIKSINDITSQTGELPLVIA